MMYHMKNIVVHDAEIDLPKCMYTIRNRANDYQEDDININISNQGSSKMTELEHRQDLLLQKLDTLYDRIKAISTNCNVQAVKSVTSTRSFDKHLQLPTPEEVVLVVSPDSLPWYLNIVLKKAAVPVNISWHIHSSVPAEKEAKIKSFVQKLPTLNNKSKINIRLIFKCVAADTQLKLSSLAAPIVGNVNILRYLSYVYPTIILNDPNDHQIDYLLDQCHLLERTTDKNKEALVNKVSSYCKDWMYGNEFSIVDLAAYNTIKQWKNIPRFVNKSWFDKCDKLVS